MRNKLTLPTLSRVSHILCSDEDQPTVMALGAGFDLRGRLVVAIDCIDYDDPRNNCSTFATVPPGDNRRMARRHRIEPSAVPSFISECMAEWREIINPDFNRVADCFKEITECLLDEGCHLRIHRTLGHGGQICC